MLIVAPNGPATLEIAGLLTLLLMCIDDELHIPARESLSEGRWSCGLDLLLSWLWKLGPQPHAEEGHIHSKISASSGVTNAK